jgi:NADH:ubiquinone reductase (H+-translocating)
VKRLINTQVIYPPTDGTAEALLASSSTDLAERARNVDRPKRDLDSEKAT